MTEDRHVQSPKRPSDPLELTLQAVEPVCQSSPCSWPVSHPGRKLISQKLESPGSLAYFPTSS